MPTELDALVYLDLTTTSAADLARIAKERLANRASKEDALAALSDEELYRRFAETRSAVVLNLLFERLYPIVRAACSTYGLATEDAEDIAQNTIVSLLHRAPELAPVGNFRRLIWAMARNAAVHLDRRKRREASSAEESAARDAQEPTSSDPRGALIENEDARAAVQRAEEALAALTEDEKRLVMLHLVDGVSYEELSRLLSVTPASARLRLHRILQKLRRRFEVPVENG
jgi:RNA polymerase sigma-70 factor (ECF subfamily)